MAQVFAEPFGLGYLAYVCGLLHDLGKYSPSFKKYMCEVMAGKNVKRGEVHHAWEGAMAILQTIGDDPAMIGLADILANVVASHHGGVTDMIADSERVMPNRLGKHIDSNPEEYRESVSFPEAVNLLNEVDWTAVRVEFSELRKHCEKRSFPLHLAVKLIFSCLVDADRCNAAGMKNDGASPDWGEMERCLDARLEDFSKTPLKDRSPLDAVRATISSQCAEQANRAPGVFTLSVPTGGGKTLSSLRFAIRHARANGLKRIVYVIPYLSIIDQTAREFRDIFKDRADEWILEHHSNFQLESENEDDEKRYDLGTQRWDSPIIVTTMVQFLESVFSNRASDLRKFHNMTESVFVFDEVQALPVKCTHLFNETVNFLKDVGKSSCVLCSATQPALAKTVHPLRLSDDSGLVLIPPSSKALFHRTNLVDMTSSALSCEEIADLAHTRFLQGESTLVVMNTKAEARKVFEAVPNDLPKRFLSTDMCPAHRLNVIDEIRSGLDLDDDQSRRPFLCVSTQLIEAGVDISFDCVIRALAGFDSIVQVAGRCNRHGHSRMPQDVILVRVADEDRSLSNLPEINLGKQISARIIDEGLLEDRDRALERYYEYKFGNPEQKRLLDYPIEDQLTTLVNLLGKNDLARQAYRDAHGGVAYPGLHSAFQTAAEQFAVIEGFHIGVVVPYDNPKNPGEAQALVGKFIGTRERIQETHDRDEMAGVFRERSRILRRLQQYSISVYANREDSIRQIASKIDDTFYFLSPAHYDAAMGLTATQGFLSA